MQKWTVALLFITCLLTELAQAKIETVIGSVPLAHNANLSNLMPEAPIPEIIISRDQYVIGYNRANRAPAWVAWKVEGQDLGKVKRSNTFMKDPDLEQYLARTGEDTAVDTSEYTGSCFDRGHQIPSGDRTDSESNNAETFLMSNMIPQTPYLNRVVWEHLESYTRDLVMKQNKKAFVIAGPIYDEDFGAIGPRHDIPVPSKDFKIIFILDAGQSASDIGPNTPSIAVIMPNTLQDGSKPTVGGCKLLTPESAPIANDHNDWQKYQTTIAEVEKASGIHLVSH